jgi:hypothetical protein
MKLVSAVKIPGSVVQNEGPDLSFGISVSLGSFAVQLPSLVDGLATCSDAVKSPFDSPGDDQESLQLLGLSFATEAPRPRENKWGYIFQNWFDIPQAFYHRHLKDGCKDIASSDHLLGR